MSEQRFCSCCGKVMFNEVGQVVPDGCDCEGGRYAFFGRCRKHAEEDVLRLRAEVEAVRGANLILGKQANDYAAEIARLRAELEKYAAGWRDVTAELARLRPPAPPAPDPHWRARMAAEALLDDDCGRVDG